MRETIQNLTEAVSLIDDRYLDLAEKTNKEILEMSKNQRSIVSLHRTMRTVLIAAVLVSLLTATAFAAGLFSIKDRPAEKKTSGNPAGKRTDKRQAGTGKKGNGPAEAALTEALSGPVKEKKKKSRCPVSSKCGGCTMIDIDYDTQIRQKQEKVDNCIGDYVWVDPIIRMKKTEHYRNKVTSVFGFDRKGKPVCGIYREGTHEIVPVKECLLEDLRADRIIQTIFELLPSFKIPVYNEKTRSGLVRYVQVRTAHRTREIMVTIVTAEPMFPSRNNFVKTLLKAHPEITTVVQNINDKETTMVLGSRENVLFGRGYIEDELCGKRFRISSRSFYQVNSLQTEKLYNIAIDYAGLSGKERIMDAYCGIGTIGIIASDKCREVLSVELNREAVKDARYNAQINNADNVRIVAEDATRYMVDLAERGEQLDVLFMDPPRSGSTTEFLRAAADLGPKKIVYVSCNPDTLARDLDQITEMGYDVKKAVPVDLFPYTTGVETVVLMSKSKS